MLTKPGNGSNTVSRPQHELAKKILGDSEKLMKRTLHVSPMLKFYVFFLMG